MHEFPALRLRGVGHTQCDATILVAPHPDIALDVIKKSFWKFAAAIDR
jgi:hypothetical protein